MLLLGIGAALLPLQIWPPMPLPGMQLADAVFALALLQFLLARPAIPPLAAAVPAAAFAAGALASALAGGSPVKLLGHVELAALGWMAACASVQGAHWLRRALVAAAAFAALTAMAGLALFFSGLAGYVAQGYPDHPLLYLHGSLVPGDYPRPRGTLLTGALLTAVVASGLALLWFEPDLVPRRWLRRAILAIAAVAMVFAFSRSVATLAVVLSGVELWRRSYPARARAAWAATAFAYAVLLWVSLRHHVVLQPLEPWSVEVLAEDGGRYARWRIALAVIAEHPLLGLGPGILVADGWEAHNTWLNLWAGLGLLPLAAFAALILAALRGSMGARSLGLASALLFAVVESSYNDVEDMRHLWLLIGLAIGAGRAHPAGARTPSDAPAAPHDVRS